MPPKRQKSGQGSAGGAQGGGGSQQKWEAGLLAAQFNDVSLFSINSQVLLRAYLFLGDSFTAQKPFFIFWRLSNEKADLIFNTLLFCCNQFSGHTMTFSHNFSAVSFRIWCGFCQVGEKITTFSGR